MTWRIKSVDTPGDQAALIVGENGYNFVGDELGDKHYLVIEGVGGLYLEDAGKHGGHWAVKVNDDKYWYYEGGGDAEVTISKDGDTYSYTMSGGIGSPASGQVIPYDNFEFSSEYEHQVSESSRKASYSFDDPRLPLSNLYRNQDKVELQAPNGKYLTVENGTVFAKALDRSNATTFTVEEHGRRVKFKTDNGYLKASGEKLTVSGSDSTAWVTEVTQDGFTSLSIDRDRYVYLGKDKNSMRVEKSSSWRDFRAYDTSLLTGFRKIPTETILERNGVEAVPESELSDCELAEIEFGIHMVSGFLVFVGFPTYAVEEISRRAFFLLKGNDRAWAELMKLFDMLMNDNLDHDDDTVQRLADAVGGLDRDSTPAEVDAALATVDIGEPEYRQMLRVIKVCYEEGILTELAKEAVEELGFWGMVALAGKIASYAVTPYATLLGYAAELSAWAYDMYELGVKMNKKCDNPGLSE